MPRGFALWVAATIGSDLGSGILAFALIWVASGHGPDVAAAVMTLTVAPSVLLGLLGGAVADRFGPRRVMICCVSALIMTSVALALVVMLWTAQPAILMIAAVTIGTITAFSRPAAGVFPRLFVSDQLLGAAMARVGMAGQLARTVAPPLGGVLVGMILLDGIAVLDAVGGLLMLIVLALVHPPLTLTDVPEPVSLRGIGMGVMTAVRTAGAPAILACVAIVAGAVVPAVILGIPLAARERGWSSGEAGVIESGWIAGGLLCGAWFAWRGTASRVWLPMTAGPVVVAVGLGILAMAPTWTIALCGTSVLGAGVVIFTAHVFPTYLLLAPPAMASRFQSLLILVQLTPQLAINPLIGFAVSVFGAGTMLAASAALALTAAVVVTSDRTLRAFVAGRAED
ncbi:MFS transporter [Microbacterium arabinogalactanolyticum]|uniref:MFS transporter n=1 Tax=Microbacterium arabinogalactanolyticum TaxID=69365 RepID=UPI00404414A5